MVIYAHVSYVFLKFNFILPPKVLHLDHQNIIRLKLYIFVISPTWLCFVEVHRLLVIS